VITVRTFRLRNDLGPIYCVGWGVKLYSLTTVRLCANIVVEDTATEKRTFGQSANTVLMSLLDVNFCGLYSLYFGSHFNRNECGVLPTC